ncbi:MAG: TetR/AcrR family transcriptional regulator [Chthonomonas sp.]|nr:TetR/AcrR family transcriptional regulator [Chthonomonas sp.]
MSTSAHPSPAQHALQIALVDLAIEQGYDCATVQLIAQRAGVARSTFYGHYGCKDDLFAATLSRLHHSMVDHWRQSQRVRPTPGELSFLRPLIYHLCARRDLWCALRNSSARRLLVKGFKTMIADLAARDLGLEKPPSMSDQAMLSCLAGAFLEMMDRWLRGELRGPKEEIALNFERAAQAVTRSWRA